MVKWQVLNWSKRAIEFHKGKGALIDNIEIDSDLLL